MVSNDNRRIPVDGVLLLNKPAGLTSNQALQRVKRLIGAKKAGHTGSLDPAATGMLPLCFGEATKVCAFLLEADKTYRVTARLGSATETGDGDGEVIATAEVPDLSREAWQAILSGFVGESLQTPPMYSALKKDGKRLYELARRGIEVERDARPIRIDRIELLEAAGSRLVFRVRCSKGTYVRTLVEDIAKAAGTLAYTAALHREAVAGFESGGMLDLSAVEALADAGRPDLVKQLLPPDRALSAMPAVSIAEGDVARFRSGQPVRPSDTAPAGLVRVYGAGDEKEFVGVGEAVSGSTVAPKRVFAERRLDG